MSVLYLAHEKRKAIYKKPVVFLSSLAWFFGVPDFKIWCFGSDARPES